MMNNGTCMMESFFERDLFYTVAPGPGASRRVRVVALAIVLLSSQLPSYKKQQNGVLSELSSDLIRLLLRFLY